MVEHFYFFSSLLPLRLAQMVKDWIIPSDGLYSNYWPWPSHFWITDILTAVLAIDFKLNRALAQMGVRLPGLSLCYLCRKN